MGKAWLGMPWAGIIYITQLRLLCTVASIGQELNYSATTTLHDRWTRKGWTAGTRGPEGQRGFGHTLGLNFLKYSTTATLHGQITQLPLLYMFAGQEKAGQRARMVRQGQRRVGHALGPNHLAQLPLLYAVAGEETWWAAGGGRWGVRGGKRGLGMHWA